MFGAQLPDLPVVHSRVLPDIQLPRNQWGNHRFACMCVRVLTGVATIPIAGEIFDQGPEHSVRFTAAKDGRSNCGIHARGVLHGLASPLPCNAREAPASAECGRRARARGGRVRPLRNHGVLPQGLCSRLVLLGGGRARAQVGSHGRDGAVRQGAILLFKLLVAFQIAVLH